MGVETRKEIDQRVVEIGKVFDRQVLTKSANQRDIHLVKSHQFFASATNQEITEAVNVLNLALQERRDNHLACCSSMNDAKQVVTISVRSQSQKQRPNTCFPTLTTE